MQAARLIPYANLVLNRFSRVRCHSASETEVLQEAEVESVMPPIALPHTLEQVVGAHPWSTVEKAKETATQTQVTHQPVLRHRIDNALVSPDGFWALGLSRRYAWDIYIDVLRRKVTRREEVHYCGNRATWQYFGHWLMDGLPMMKLVPPGAETWLRAQSSWDHAVRYLELLDMVPLRDDLIFTSQLHVYEDFSQGSLKKARYAAIRERIRWRIKTDRGAQRVYLKRGTSGLLRQVVNEAELEAGLLSHGFRIVDVPSSSVDEILESTLGAEIVIGVEGSHLAHAHYAMATGGLLLTLTEPDRFVLWHLGLCRAVGTRMAFYMLQGRAKEGYRANLDDILRTLDLAGAG